MRKKIGLLAFIASIIFLITVSVSGQKIEKVDAMKKLPDLAPISINVVAKDGGPLELGKEARILCSFKNIGGMFHENFGIAFKMDGKPVGQGLFYIVSPTRTSMEISWIAAVGEHIAKCIVDSQGDITESNEDNNVMLKTFTVPSSISAGNLSVADVPIARLKPDITIEKIEVKADDGGAVKPGKASKIYCHWKRTGSQPATTFRVNVKMDGTSIGAGTVDHTMTSSWLAGPWVATVGKHQIYCEVDYENVVNEVNEKNNKWIQLYYLPGITPSDIGHPALSEKGTDVMIEKIEVKAEDGGKLIDNEDARIYCYWKRTGPAPAADFRVAVFVDGHVIGLPQGSTVQHELDHGWLGTPWKADHGFHKPTIECLADSAFEIAEPNETNNKMSIRIDIPSE